MAAHDGPTQSQSVSFHSASTVRRVPLPLAKLRTTKSASSSTSAVTSSSQETIQRSPTSTSEAFVGATAGNGPRGLTQSENLGGVLPQSTRDPVYSSGDRGGEDGNENKKEPDLDRLARAIVPLVKRMLKIERERRTYR
jgi:hypothetical protein